MRSTQRLPFGFNPRVEHRNARLRRSTLKRGRPTPEQHTAAILRAGYLPLIEPPPPPINHELRKTLGAP